MDGFFELSIDPVRGFMRTRLGGFFEQDTLDRYLAARSAALAQLRCGPNQHLSLVDLREMKIQAQDVVARFGAALADPVHRSKRLAFVMGGTLARAQLLRILGDRPGDACRCYAETTDAEHWVLTGRDRTCAARSAAA